MNLFPKQKQAHRQRRQCMVTEVEGGGQKSGLRMGRYTLLHFFFFFSRHVFLFYFIFFKLYIIVLVLPNITHTLLHLKYIASQDPVHSTGHVACRVSRSVVSASLRPHGL